MEDPRAAGATMHVTLTTTGSTAGLEPGGYLTLNRGGVVGVAKGHRDVKCRRWCNRRTYPWGKKDLGFFNKDLAVSTDDTFVTLGQLTCAGQTFANASTGLTAASVRWKYANEFDQKLPATSSSVEAHGASFDLLHAIVVDEDGDWTGTKGTVLERFDGLSKALNAKRENGSSIYYKDVINANSQYVYSAAKPGVRLSGKFQFGENSTSAGGTFARLSQNYYESLAGGTAAAPAQTITTIH